MGKSEYITKPISKWLYSVPFGFMFGYNILRQEMFANLPPLFELVKDWHWSIWLLLFLLVVAIIVIEGFIRFNKNEKHVHDSGREGILAKSVNNSPIVKAETSGIAVGRDLHQTTNNYISSIPQRIGTLPSTDITGNIRLKHNTSLTDNDGNELEFKFTLFNDTNTDFRECAVYVDEIAYKPKKSRDWIRLDDLPSQKTLKWDVKFVLSDGFTSIGSGQRESFFLLKPQSKVFNKGELGYNYDFFFHADNVRLPESDSPNHRILIRFHGSRIFGGGVDNRFYIFLTEGKPKFKKYEKIELMKDSAA